MIAAAQVCEIAVVGGGPVGLACAAALAQAGFGVALIERAPRPVAWSAQAPLDARVYAIAPASARVLASIGVWDTIAAARASPYRAMKVWEREAAQGLRFETEDEARPLGWIVEHGLIVDALWRTIADSVAVLATQPQRIAWPAAGSARTARLMLADGRTLEARLVIAADGAESQVRRMAGIGTLAWPYAQRALVCHLRTARPHGGTAYQRFLRSGPLAFLPLADGRCSLVWSADLAEAERLMALDESGFREALTQASEGVLGEVLEITPRRAVPLQALHAADYTAPALALVGDAAHAIHPLAGQGVNLGFADVEALAATLGDAREAGRDWSAARTLARYARARKAANLEMLALTDGLHRAFTRKLPGLRALLGLGLEAADRVQPVKHWLARRAAG